MQVKSRCPVWIFCKIFEKKFKVYFFSTTGLFLREICTKSRDVTYKATLAFKTRSATIRLNFFSLTLNSKANKRTKILMIKIILILEMNF